MDATFSRISLGIDDLYFNVKPEIPLMHSVPTWECFNFSFNLIISFVINIDKSLNIVVNVHCRIRISGRDIRLVNKDPETSIVFYGVKVSCP